MDINDRRLLIILPMMDYTSNSGYTLRGIHYALKNSSKDVKDYHKMVNLSNVGNGNLKCFVDHNMMILGKIFWTML